MKKLGRVLMLWLIMGVRIFGYVVLFLEGAGLGLCDLGLGFEGRWEVKISQFLRGRERK